MMAEKRKVFFFLLQDTMSKEQHEDGRVEVLPVQWRKHLTLEVTTACLHHRPCLSTETPSCLHHKPYAFHLKLPSVLKGPAAHCTAASEQLPSVK